MRSCVDPIYKCRILSHTHRIWKYNVQWLEQIEDKIFNPQKKNHSLFESSDMFYWVQGRFQQR